MKNYYNRGVIKTLGDHSILNLGEIIRYNNRPKIKHENVAEHSFYVVTTVLKICSIFSIPDEIKLKALEFAAVHDCAESMIGDIPFHTKENNPVLRQAIEAAEVEAMSKDMPYFADLYEEFLEEEKNETIAYLIVKLADVASVLQYSNREIELGNQSPSMEEINDGAYFRVNKYTQKLIDSLNQGDHENER